jgi:histidine triad (HIT) family protein
MMTYDSNNIFAKILRGEIPAHKIYEDEHVLAFMDVMPMADGHCLVVPKAPSRGLLDADPTVLMRVMPVVQKVAKAAVSAMGADGFQVRQYNENVAGQTVFHLHFHILPMKEGVPLRPHTGKMADHALLAEQTEKIKKEISR